MGISDRHLLQAIIWKIGIPLLCGLAFLICTVSAPSDKHRLRAQHYQGTGASVQLHPGSTSASKCLLQLSTNAQYHRRRCADGVLRLANKVSSTTVENILDAASSNDPSEKTVRVRNLRFSKWVIWEYLHTHPKPVKNCHCLHEYHAYFPGEWRSSSGPQVCQAYDKSYQQQ